MALDWLPIDWVTGTIAAITLAYIYLTWNNDYWKKRGVPFQKPAFLFGNYKDVFFMKKIVGDLMADIYRQQDGLPYVGVFRFRTPGLLVRDPELVRSVLVKDFASFQQNAFPVNEDLDPLLARNLFFISGEKWKKVRSLLTPSFTSGKMKPLFPIMEQVAQEMVQFLQDTAPSGRPDGIEAKDLCTKYTTDVVADAAFGIPGDSFKDPDAEMRRMGRKILTPSHIGAIKSLFLFVEPALSKVIRVRFMSEEVANFYRRIVKEAMDYRIKNNVTRKDYLQGLMQMKQKAMEYEYTDEDVTAHAASFIVDGFETSSIVLSFLLYELAMNPDVQERLRADLEEAVRETDGQLSYDIVNGLPYLDMVLSETLRMHSPLLNLEKFCTKPYELPRPSGGSFTVEPGTLVIIPTKALHYDPRYFPEPHKFDPDRFSQERKDIIPRYAYIPFGEGPRMCLGMRFAHAQVKTAVASLLLSHEIKKTPKTPGTIVQDPNYFLAAAKGGLWLDFVTRN